MIRFAMSVVSAALVLASASASGATPQETLAEVAPHRALRTSQPPTIPASAYTRALTGEVVTGLAWEDGSSIAKGWGVGVLNFPVDALWMAANDEERGAEFMPVSVSVVVSGRAGHTGREVFEYLPAPFGADRWWVAEQRHDATLYTQSGGKLWELSWVTVDGAQALQGTPHEATAAGGTEVAWARGAWLFIPLDDGRTLGEYFGWSDPGGNIPAGLASRFAASTVEDMFTSVSRLAATYTPADRARFVRPDGAPLVP